MTNKNGCARVRSSQHANERIDIELTTKLLDDLRQELDAAIARRDNVAVRALLDDIKALAATLDEVIAATEK